MPTLIIKSGPDAGKRFEINSEAVVGRGEVDCVIDDAELSRRHITVRSTPAGVEVEDLGSLNGTWFNGKRLETATVIPDGGVIRLGGKVELTIEVAQVTANDARTVVAPVVAPPPAAAEPAPAVAEPAPAAAEPPPAAAQPAPVAAEPPPAAADPPPVEPAAEHVSEGPPPTNIPEKPRAKSKPPPEPAAPDASTVPPRRRAAPPAPPSSKSRRGVAPAGAGAAAAPLGAFSPPGKAGRRTVATRLVLPAFMTFLVIFATAIALIIYFAAR